VSFDLGEYMKARAAAVDVALDRFLPAESEPPETLHRAMRYSVFAGGKRLRPVLALAAAEAVDALTTPVLPFAAALELIHTYSLIHDDLPAMDDDDLRRGKPTNHRVYGEGLAILAGDALLTEAFRIMAEAAAKLGKQQSRALQVIVEVAQAAGARGMVAGQAADLQAENAAPDLPTVEWIHIRKTGEMIRAAVRAGALLGGARADELKRLTRYAEYLGLAFQIADDILDAEGSVAMTGKNIRRDQVRHKATFPAVLGVPAAKERARELVTGAVHELRPFGRQAEPLRAVAHYAVGRARLQ